MTLLIWIKILLQKCTSRQKLICSKMKIFTEEFLEIVFFFQIFCKICIKQFSLIGIHSMQAEQPLQDMALQEKEARKDKSMQEISSERT